MKHECQTCKHWRGHAEHPTDHQVVAKCDLHAHHNPRKLLKFCDGTCERWEEKNV